jgi:uncharacterized membrane protein YphA (DoxX/SURF4 family)
MTLVLESPTIHTLAQIAIGGVWVFHGLYSKVLNGIPRHRQIVERVLGKNVGHLATIAIGILEVLLGIWVFSGWQRVGCAVVQMLAIVGMNTLEIIWLPTCSSQPSGWRF